MSYFVFAAEMSSAGAEDEFGHSAHEDHEPDADNESENSLILALGHDIFRSGKVFDEDVASILEVLSL
ncbi:hypothetical protein EON65_10900 [archaeon]|nr:MAG: hypothetical protein EON65_10900 [archaeon]